jgi:hypothetical protein
MALVEFALSLPLVVALGVGGIELANFALTNVRVNQIALSVADNAGRVTSRIDEANIVEVFAGARVTGEPINFQENGRIVLSSLEHNGLDDDDEGRSSTGSAAGASSMMWSLHTAWKRMGARTAACPAWVRLVVRSPRSKARL